MPIIGHEAPRVISPFRTWCTVALLAVIAVVNYADRLLPTVLAELIKRDLHLSDTLIGLIFGFGFLFIYATVAIPIARLADRGYQRAVICLSLIAWSGMTMLGGWAQSGWQFASTRAGVALGEAGSMPASQSYISRNVPPGARTIAFALLSISAPLSKLLALVGGGYLASHIGWRSTLIVVGGLGFLLALLPYFVMREPSQREIRTQAAPGARPPSSLLIFRQRSSVFMLAGCAFVAAGGYANSSFATAFLMRVHGLSIVEAGTNFGIIASIVGTSGILLVGGLTDRLSVRDDRWLLGVTTVTLVAGLPFAVIGFMATSTSLVLVCLAANSINGAAYMAPVVAALHQIVEPELRARASAVVLFFSAIFGGLGPLSVGFVSDMLLPSTGVSSLAWAMMCVIPLCFAVGAILFALSMLSMSRAETSQQI